MRHYIKIAIILTLILWAWLRIAAIRWMIDEILVGKITLTLWIIWSVLVVLYLLIQEDKRTIDKF
jgi:hypothetical protein